VNYDNSFVVTITVTCNLGHRLTMTIYLHVAPSICRHIVFEAPPQLRMR